MDLASVSRSLHRWLSWMSASSRLCKVPPRDAANVRRRLVVVLFAMSQPLTFLDINTFYCPKGGGIRTYHHAKIAYFREHATQHRYVLVYPGRSREVKQLADNITLIRVAGVPTGKDPEGYHVLFDLPQVMRQLRDVDPDVVEAGEPWVAGPLALALAKRWAARQPLVSSFYHSDPARTYLDPWASKATKLAWRQPIASLAGRALIAMQRRFDATLTASDTMRDYLQSQGVSRVFLTPFGADPFFFTGERTPSSNGKIRLLYAGRLDADKGMDVLLAARDELLRDENVELTVAGRGAFAATFASYQHPRYRFVGHLTGAQQMRDIMLTHDILLAPGPYETFGLVVLEAMATGMVVVGPNGAGTGELLAQCQSPFTFAAGDRRGFVQATREACSGGLPALAQDSLRVAQQYGSWDAAIARMISTYESLR